MRTLEARISTLELRAIPTDPVIIPYEVVTPGAPGEPPVAVKFGDLILTRSDQEQEAAFLARAADAMRAERHWGASAPLIFANQYDVRL